VLKIERELFLVQETAIALVEASRQIPVEQRDEGGDAGLQEVVNELDVVVDALLVDWVIAAAKRNDSGPRQGEAVGVGADGLQELDILFCSVVRIASNSTRASIGNLAGNGAEIIPNGRATTILLGSTFDLVAKNCMPEGGPG
jgi:hypothetical protein